MMVATPSSATLVTLADVLGGVAGGVDVLGDVGGVDVLGDAGGGSALAAATPGLSGPAKIGLFGFVVYMI